MTERILIRAAEVADRPAVDAIYDHYVLTSHCTFDTEPVAGAPRTPWHARFTRDGPYRLLVAERAGNCLGYACTLPFKERPAYRTSAEVAVYLAPEATGRGIATALYAELFARIAGQDLHRLVACIAIPNEASVALHRRFGFREVGRLSEAGYKFGRFWDVAYFERPVLQTQDSARDDPGPHQGQRREGEAT